MNLYVKVKYDKNAVLKKITQHKAFINKGWIAAERIAKKRYLESKNKFFKNFNSHEVTREIEAGSGAENTSDLLGGEGNLFSFFGFDEGSDPIGDLRFYLENSFDFARAGYRQRVWNFKIRFPDAESAENYVVGKFGADYTSESWVEGVEKGYSGLGYYLRYDNKGRSGGGIQVKSAVRELNFKTTKYLSEMISNFKKDIK